MSQELREELVEMAEFLPRCHRWNAEVAAEGIISVVFVEGVVLGISAGEECSGHTLI